MPYYKFPNVKSDFVNISLALINILSVRILPTAIFFPDVNFWCFDKQKRFQTVDKIGNNYKQLI